jgi:hypothetical protein
VAGDRVSGWRLVCPGCGAPSLLPGALARSGARVRCPACATIFAAAEPHAVDLCARALEEWSWNEPGGKSAVVESRRMGRFWEAHGESLLDFCETGEGAQAPGEVVRAALVRVLGPGRPLF